MATADKESDNVVLPRGIAMARRIPGLAFVLVVVFAIACSPGVSGAAVTTYYDFEGNYNDFPGAGVFADDLTTVQPGASLVADAPANAVGSTMSYAFDARVSDSRVWTADWSPDLTSTDQYTIMFWLKADDDNQPLNNTRLATVRYDAANVAQGAGVGWQIEGFGQSSSGNGPDLRIQGGTVGNFFAAPANGALGNDGDPPAGTPDEWHHIAFVVSNTGGPGGLAYMETYLDGASVGVRTNTPTTDTDLLRNPNGRLILGGHNVSARSATGQLDDFVLFDEVVDPQTINQIATGQISPADLLGPPPPPPPAGPLSISFDAQAGFDFPGGNTNPIPVGEPDNDVGLILPGQVGPWNSLLFGNGQVNISFTQERSITVDGVTFTWNPGADQSYFTFVNPVDDLRGTVPFLRATGNTTIDWEISGLEAGAAYDLILFGQEQDTDGNAVNPADIAILGHDAGNGIGNPVTLDAENDANFIGVIASPAGLIQGTMSVRPGEGFAAVAGLQLMAPESATAIPEPSTFALAALGLLSLGIVGWRRRRN